MVVGVLGTTSLLGFLKDLELLGGIVLRRTDGETLSWEAGSVIDKCLCGWGPCSYMLPI